MHHMCQSSPQPVIINVVCSCWSKRAENNTTECGLIADNQIRHSKKNKKTFSTISLPSMQVASVFIPVISFYQFTLVCLSYLWAFWPFGNTIDMFFHFCLQLGRFACFIMTFAIAKDLDFWIALSLVSWPKEVLKQQKIGMECIMYHLEI